MKQYSIDYLVEQERNGTIYAKVAKSKPDNNVHGGYFPYKQWKDRVVDCASCGFTNGTTTIEPLEVALTYFHYGDQLVIMNFEKTENQLESGVFSAYANMKKGCFDVSICFRFVQVNKRTLPAIVVRRVSCIYGVMHQRRY